MDYSNNKYTYFFEQDLHQLCIDNDCKKLFYDSISITPQEFATISIDADDSSVAQFMAHCSMEVMFEASNYL